MHWKEGSVIWRTGQWNLPKQSSKKKKEVLKSEDSLMDLWDKIKQNNCIIGISERENIEKGTKKCMWRNNVWKLSYPGNRSKKPREFQIRWKTTCYMLGKLCKTISSLFSENSVRRKGGSAKSKKKKKIPPRKLYLATLLFRYKKRSFPDKQKLKFTTTNQSYKECKRILRWKKKH